MRWSEKGKYVLHNDYKTLSIWDDTPDDLINKLQELKKSYPYTYRPTVGEPYKVLFCTLELRREDYDEYYSVFINEWREPTEEDIRQRDELLEKERRQSLEWKRKQLEQLKKELGENE